MVNGFTNLQIDFIFSNKYVVVKEATKSYFTHYSFVVFILFNTLFIRLVFSWFFDICGNLGNFKEKPTRKTCFSREMKRLALRIYLAKFC